MEHGEWDEVMNLKSQYGTLEAQDLMSLHMQALAWSDEQIEAIQGA